MMSNPDHTHDQTPTAAVRPLGNLDRCEGNRVIGWAAPPTGGEARLLVELHVDGEPVARGLADMHRADVEAAGVGDGCCGFELVLPLSCQDGNTHRLEVMELSSGALLEGGLMIALEAAPQEPPFTAAEHGQSALGTPATASVRPRVIDGRLDACGPNGVLGWAVRTDGRLTPVDVELVVDGMAVARCAASIHRADLASAEIGTGRHGYCLVPPESLFDDVPRNVIVREASTGEVLIGSPAVLRLNAAHLWDRSDDDDIQRRLLASQALSFFESSDDDALDSDMHDILLRLQSWLKTQPAKLTSRRVQAQLNRLTALRCVISMDGLVIHNEISGTISDRWSSDADDAPELGLTLLEGGAIVARTELKVAARENAQHFTLTLDESLLDHDVHRLGLRVDALGGVLGPWSYLLAPQRSDAELLALAADPVWATLPAVLAAQRRQKKARKAPTAVELARAVLDDALAEAAEAPQRSAARKDDESQVVVLQARCNLGDAMRSVGHWADAVAEFRAALEIDAEHLKAITGLVRSLLDMGDEVGAEETLADVMARLPDEGALHALADDLRGRKRIHNVRTLAFYLPQFHPTPENNEWWGEGFTEWHNVGGATPMFAGHLQPRRPTTLGYYDLRLPEVVNAQFDLARKYGIDGFCYYYYWFEGRRILNRPLDDLAAGRTGPFPFCICWANEDWTRAWDGTTGEVLLAQNHSSESDLRFIQDLAPLLRHPDYIRVDGKPMVLVYRADKLATPKETAEQWRQWCRDQGIGELHLCAVQSFGFHDPRPLGFDAAVEFPPHCPWSRYPEPGYLKQQSNLPGTVEGFTGVTYDYQAFAKAAIARPREPFTLHRASMVAWDNTARRGKNAVVYNGFSVETFERWVLANARRAAVEQDDAVCFINAWNEWAEGSVMEPDSHFGYAVLESVHRASLLARADPASTYWLAGKPLRSEQRLTPKERVLLVGHDAFPSGAQTNMLNMARTLKRLLGMDVSLMLIEGGELLPEFERVAPTYVIGKTGDWRSNLQVEIRRLYALGARKAICNTVLTGDVAEVLKNEGYLVVGLLHELPTLIEAYGLQPQCWRFADKPDAIVCASKLVSEEFFHRYWPDPKKILVTPQGIVFNQHHNSRMALRQAVREEMGLPEQARLVIGCGYGDTRKGIDLFVQMAGEVARIGADEVVAFVWIGAIDPPLAPYVDADVNRLGLQDVFRVTGRLADPGRYFIAADLFTLTSREDPFPSVVMEAFDAGLPVVAFAGGGGYAEIVNDASGALVPYIDVAAMARSVVDYLRDDQRRTAVGAANHALCRERFGYAPYMRKLLALLDGVPADQVAAGHLERQAWFSPRPKATISVIVPNYNYARHLELRLRTVIGQTLQPDEIIVLDDASTDGSLDVIAAMAAVSSIPIRIVTNKVNTGNPFVQWAKGLELASGELVWIAEADDYCEPTLLETLAGELADEKVVMAWADSVMVDEDGRSQGAQYKDYYGRSYGTKWKLSFRVDGPSLIEDCLLIENVVPNASAVVFRRSAVAFDLNPIKEYRFSGDWWFWLRLAQQGDVVYRHQPLNYHRRHAQSVMGAVLKSGAHLLNEMMGFYQRALAAVPAMVAVAASDRLLRRLSDIFNAYPDLHTAQSAAAHPELSERFESLTREISSLKAASVNELEASTTVLLSHDVMDGTCAGRDLFLQLLTANPDARLILLAPQALAADFIKDLPIAASKVISVALGALTVQPHPVGQANQAPISIATRLCEALGDMSQVRLVTHGLLAHSAAGEAAAKGGCRDWWLVAGSDFESLLGAPSVTGVTTESLRQSITNCSRAFFLGKTPPHAFSRMAHAQLVVQEQWETRSAPRSARAASTDAGVLRFVGIGHQAPHSAWRAVAEALRIAERRLLVPVRLRILVWGEADADIEQLGADEPGVELVRVNAQPTHLTLVGEVLVDRTGPDFIFSNTTTAALHIPTRHRPKTMRSDTANEFDAYVIADDICKATADFSPNKHSQENKLLSHP
jgi:glycosyltransferase involved in cell wall biosynthesis